MDGIVADRLASAIMSTDGQRVRIIFEQAGGEFYFEADRTELAAFMPLLSKFTNPEGPQTPTIRITDLRTATTRPGGPILLTLVNTAGTEMTFGLTPQLAGMLVSLVGIALQEQADPTQQH